MSLHVAAGAIHTYRANESELLLSEVASVQCILLPRAFLVAGFSEAGKVVMARYNSYASTDPVWERQFFEQEFMTEPLFGVPQQVKAIFAGSEDAMLIPTSLFEADAARGWLEQLHTICPTDVLRSYKLENADAQYVFALPEAIDKLLQRYFEGVPVLPVAAYQFHKPAKSDYVMQCLITEERVMASLHQSGRLLWHQQFDYSTAEDIAWQAAYLCRELHIPRIDLNIQACLLCETCFGLIAELEQYFPKMKWSVNTPAEGGDWAPAVYLLQQLYACAL